MAQHAEVNKKNGIPGSLPGGGCKLGLESTSNMPVAFLLPQLVDFSGNLIKGHCFFRDPLSDLRGGDWLETLKGLSENPVLGAAGCKPSAQRCPASAIRPESVSVQR
jgi:hypothetical protein